MVIPLRFCSPWNRPNGPPFSDRLPRRRNKSSRLKAEHAPPDGKPVRHEPYGCKRVPRLQLKRPINGRCVAHLSKITSQLPFPKKGGGGKNDKANKRDDYPAEAILRPGIDWRLSWGATE